MMHRKEAGDALVSEIKDGSILLKTVDYDCDYFELSSGKYVKEFITIWSLSQDTELLCIKALSEDIFEYKKNAEKKITKIITSTKTVKEFSKGLIRELNNRMREDDDYNKHQDTVLSVYFGDYPSLDDNYKVHFFENEKVIILTDVISSGTLVKNLIELVDRNGAEVGAIFTLLITNQELIEEKAIELSIKDKNIIVPVHTLLAHRISYDQTIGEKSKVKKIGRITILPEDKPIFPNSITPIFDLETAFDHFGTTSSISYGFFNLSSKRFTTIFKIEDLLDTNDNVGQIIWKHIRETVIKCNLIITTYLDEDKIFLRFIKEKLVSEKIDSIPSIVIIKRDTRDNPFLYFTILQEERTKLAGKNVLLLFSTLSTSEKLRNISGLLSSLEKRVKSITALCLINRMGIYTTSFITRIDKIAHHKGLPVQIPFHFQAVYNIVDFSPFDLELMENTLDRFVKDYLNFTRAEYFEDIALEHLREHFLAKEFIDVNVFDTETYDENTEDKEIDVEIGDGPTVKVNISNTRAAIGFINHYTAITKKYDQVIHMFGYQKSEEALFHLFRLCICELNLHRSTGKIIQIENVLKNRIIGLRKERKHKEEGIQHFNIDVDYFFKESIKTEFSLLCIYMYFIILGHSHAKSDHKALVEFLFCKNEFPTWVKYPINFKLYFESQKPIPFYCLSLVLYSFKLNRIGKFEDIREKTKSEIDLILGQMMDVRATAEYNVNRMRATHKNIMGFELSFNEKIIRNNFSLLQTELGLLNTTNHYEIIKLLQKELIEQNFQNHIEIYINIKALLDSLESLVDNDVDAVIYQLSDKEISKLNTAISFLYSLKDISKYIRQFFSFQGGNPDECQYYLATEQRTGLTKDIGRLILHLQKIKLNNSFDKKEFDRFHKMFSDTIADKVFNYRNVLFKALFGQVVSVYDITEKVITDILTEDSLNLYKRLPEHLRNALDNLRDDYKGENESGHFYCLGDESTTRSLLRNVILNLRHSSSSLIEPNPIKIQLKIQPKRSHNRGLSFDDGAVVFILKWETFEPINSDRIEKTDSTLMTQINYLKMKGGDFDLKIEKKRNYEYEMWIRFIKQPAIYKKSINDFERENRI